jgi:hypothetical protein
MSSVSLLSVAIPIFSGLTAIAYKHPTGYARLFKSASKWLYPIFVVVLGFLLGKSDGIKAFEASAVAEVAAKAAAMQKETSDSLSTLFLYLGGAWLHLWILTYLPEITKPEADGKTEPNKAPEPTTMSVTSPAAQEPRQP